MKVFIISDSHDNWKNLDTALSIATQLDVDIILHAGDFVSPPGLTLFEKIKKPVHIVWGNNEGEKQGFLKRIENIPQITHHNFTMKENFDGLNFFMNHYPEKAKEAGKSGKYDVCVYGHTHLFESEVLKNDTIILNPGGIAGSRTGVATALLFDTDTKISEKIIIAREQFTV